jgi:hypothetical protein
VVVAGDEMVGRADGGGCWYPKASFMDPKCADVLSVSAAFLLWRSTLLQTVMTCDAKISKLTISCIRR